MTMKITEYEDAVGGGLCCENEEGETLDFTYKNKDSLYIEVELCGEGRSFTIPLNALENFIRNGMS